jgi:hypothetical protein
MTTARRLRRVIDTADAIEYRRSVAEASELNKDVLACAKQMRVLATVLIETRELLDLDTEEETGA